MSDWSAGYVSEIGYTYGYYSELNPSRVKLAFLNAGLQPPEIGVACELGYGQGLSANIHAAGSAIRWFGTDFNPDHALFARELAGVADSGAQLADDSFAEFAARTDLPEFDYIGLHGIWSWISDENRKIIVDFVRRKLRVGGVLYVSYNTLPGWSGFAAIRNLMVEHAKQSDGAGIVPRIQAAMGFAETLLAMDSRFRLANPFVAERLGRVKNADVNYLAHEYFNRDWHPMYFSAMTEWLEAAKLGYACSAQLLDHLDGINLTDEHRACINGIADVTLRETTRDVVVNQPFRRDYWVKGVRRLPVLEQAERMRAVRVILAIELAEVKLKAVGFRGEADLGHPAYRQILDLLADHQPRTVAQIEAATAAQQFSLTVVWEVVMVLCGTGALALAQDDETIARARPRTERLNARLLQAARSRGDVHFLASPVTGGGCTLSRVDQLFLAASKLGRQGAEDLAQWAWQTLASVGQGVIKEGKALATPEENLAELRVSAATFVGRKLPMLKALMIA